jgi:4-amino-4-deoxy-L-arabinose transferase-like glycosyltransferase
VFVLIALVVCAYFLRIGEMTVRGEESRWATVAIEMMRTGDWIVPRQQGEPFCSRPPLGNWLIAGASLIRGQCDAVAMRLPTATAVLLLTVLVYAFGRTFMGRIGAFAAALALASMGEVLQMGRVAESDLVFAFLLSAAWLSWLWGDRAGWPARTMWIVSYGFAALAALQKGPQGPVNFVGGVGVYLVLRGEWRRIFTVAHVLGMLTMVAIFGAWLGLYTRQVGSMGAAVILFNDSASRFTDLRAVDVIRHMATYPLEVLGCTAPWSFLLFAYASRRFRRSLGTARPIAQFLAICTAVGFAPCWVTPGGMTRYVIPLYAGVSLLAGLVVDRAAAADWSPRLSAWWVVGQRTLVALILATPVIFLIAEFVSQPVIRAYAPSLLTLLAFVGGAIATAWAIVRATRIGGRERRVALVAVACFIAAVYSKVIVDGIVSRSEDTAAAVAKVKSAMPPCARLVSFNPAWHLFAYHFGDPIELRGPPDADRDRDVDWFCYAAFGENRIAIPFPHEIVAVVPVDRNRQPVPNVVVVVGRRAPVGETPSGGE